MYGGGLGVEVPHLGGLIEIVVLIALVVLALQTQQYPKCFRGVRLDGASFYHSTYNNLHHQNMVVCLGVRKVKERFEDVDSAPEVEGDEESVS